MTIRAIDMQTMLPRLNEAGRTQQQIDRQPHVAQHVQLVTAQQEAERARQQIQQKSESERPSGQQHSKGQSHGGQEKAPKRDQSGEKEEARLEERGHRLDVKV